MDNLPCIKTFIGDNDGDLDFTSDALELHMIKEAKQHNELYPIHIKGTENIADVFTKLLPQISHKLYLLLQETNYLLLKCKNIILI